MAEPEVNVPRVGRIHASPSFRLVASMNPFDNVGTTRISTSVYDRLCRLAVGHQTGTEDREVVALRAGSEDERLVADAVAIARAPWTHEHVRHGSSVRGAIDLVAVTAPLAAIRSTGTDEEGYRRSCWTPRSWHCPAGSPWTTRAERCRGPVARMTG